MNQKFLRAALCLMLLFCVCFLAGCGDKTIITSPMDAKVSFAPTVYVSDGGMIRFLYDCEVDMLSTYDGYDIAALYSGGDYSLVVSYAEGIVSRGDADERIRAEFEGSGMELSKHTKKTDISGHPFRRAEITVSDGSVGAVCYGSTKTGFAEIYYIVAPGAPDGTLSHVEEILSTVTLGEYTGEQNEDIKIFYDGSVG